MIYGSVCSGIEAASAAWHPLGWRAAFLSEIEPFPRAVLQYHYPDVPLHGDFTTIRGGDYAAIDLLVGGTPCQSFSIAGLRKGLDDDRGNLALEYLRLADRLRPRWLVWENVPGVLSSNGGRDFGSILGGMVELGYGFAYRVLDAQYVRVDGFGRAVPQRRRRVFVVGYLGDWRRAAAVLFERESLCGNPAPRREAGKVSAPTLAARTRGGGGLGTDFDCDGGLVARCDTASQTRLDGETETFVPEISCSLLAKSNDSFDDTLQSYVAHTLLGGGFDASEDGTGRGTPLVPDGTDVDTSDSLIPVMSSGCCGSNGAGIGRSGDPAFTLDTNAAQAICFSTKDYGNDRLNDLARTMRAMGHDCSHANAGGQLGVLSGWRVRRLTPKECERLQGFPDGYTAVPYRNKMAADGPRYKALGNSMAVNVMRWIGRRIEMADSLVAVAKDKHA